MPKYENPNKFIRDTNYPEDTPYGQGFYWKHNRDTSEMVKAPTASSRPNKGYPAESTPGTPEWEQAHQPGMGVPVNENLSFSVQSQEETYQIGRMAIENELAMANNEAARWKITNPETAAFLMQNANNIAQMKMIELNQKRDRARVAFREINRDPTTNNEEKHRLKLDYISRNPLYEVQEMDMPKQDFKLQDIQKTLSELKHGGIIDNQGYMKEFLDKDTMIGYAEQNLPQDMWQQATELINQKFPEKDTEIETEQNVRPIIGKPKMKQKYIWPGGYAPQQIGVEDNRMDETETASIPQKPINYPDAVFNKQYRMWTIIKNGKLIGLKEE